MNTPELEKHLAALAQRRLPAEWKAGILESAAAPHRPAGFQHVERWVWGAVAATWVVILLLRATTPFVPPPTGSPASAAEFAAHWAEIRHYAELEFVPAESPPPTRIDIEQEIILHGRPRS